MGDIGARLLAKALQINNKLRSISFDKNNITLQGEQMQLIFFLYMVTASAEQVAINFRFRLR